MTSNEAQRVSKSTSGCLNHSQTDQRIDHSYTSFSSDRLSISNRHKYQTLFITPENSPRMPSPKPKPTRPSIPFQQHDSLVEPTCYDYSLMPSYMANTQSSRAKKVRSQSEPKQRPDGSAKHKSKHTELVDPTDEQFLRRSSSQFKPNDHRIHDPWFVKLYRPRRLFEDNNKYNLINPSTSHSNYNESLATEVKIVLNLTALCRLILHVGDCCLFLSCLTSMNCVIAAPCDFVLTAPRSSILSWKSNWTNAEDQLLL